MAFFCPSCNNNNLTCIGDIPTMNFFAGKILSKSLPKSKLFTCKNCQLHFRYPRLSKAELDNLYKNGSVANWQNSVNERKDWQLAITEFEKKEPAKSILDIGCFDGTFLSYLKGGTHLYGVEINPEAILLAQKRGVNIISKNFTGLESLTITFDIVTAFDVIEHTEDPFSFLESILKITNSNGRIILSTGNTDAQSWKISKSKYWYCSIPEHISFINEAWVRFAAAKLNLEIEHFETFSHAGNPSLFHRIFDCANNAFYLLMPNIFQKFRKLKHMYTKNEIGNLVNYPPSWMTSKDHIIVVYRKKQ